jgi:hypothetical protein
VNVQETLPTGRFDRLDHPADGFGSGAYTTTVSIYTQGYFWLANGRILRARLNVSYALSDRVRLEDASVYGTSFGFRGYASPGDSLYGDLALELSATQNWVAAIDLWTERDADTRVLGNYSNSAGLPPSASLIMNSSGTGWEQIVAPAVEYNWSARLGIIVGARVIVAGRNETASAAPVVAFSYFF